MPQTKSSISGKLYGLVQTLESVAAEARDTGLFVSIKIDDDSYKSRYRLVVLNSEDESDLNGRAYLENLKNDATDELTQNLPA